MEPNSGLPYESSSENTHLCIRIDESQNKSYIAAYEENRDDVLGMDCSGNTSSSHISLNPYKDGDGTQERVVWYNDEYVREEGQ